MKNEPLCRNSPPNVVGEVQAACRAARAPRLWPISTGRPRVANASASAGTTRVVSARAYAGLAAYRLLRRGPGLTSATRIGGRVRLAIIAPAYAVSAP